MSRVAALFALIAMMLPLTGCYEDMTPPRYEPGVYKGDRDPLLGELKSDELQGELGERVGEAFRDR